MLNIRFHNNEDELNRFSSRQEIIDFLHTHLDRFRDSKEAINKTINYAFSSAEGKGGFITTAHEDNDLVGAVIMIDTGMEEFIPENLLVYIAVNANQRGKGIGKQLMEKSIANCKGDVALHVEYDNPAKRLYEREGFTTKYAEMRYKR